MKVNHDEVSVSLHHRQKYSPSLVPLPFIKKEVELRSLTWSLKDVECLWVAYIRKMQKPDTCRIYCSHSLGKRALKNDGHILLKSGHDPFQ